MRLLPSKSNFAKNHCKIPMAALVPFLMFGCSGGKTAKTDAGEKPKDVRVQTTGSDEQRKLAMAATAVPGVSVSAVFDADADKLMAFGLKELGKSGDSLSLAGPVYKLSATAGLTPGPDGCFAILPMKSGSICFDEKISTPRFLIPSEVPGTSAVPKVGLAENQLKSSDSPKMCTKAQEGSPAVCYVLCGLPRPQSPNVVEEKPRVHAPEPQMGNEKPINAKPKDSAFESEAVVILLPTSNVKSETPNGSNLLTVPIPVPGPGTGTATQADVVAPPEHDIANTFPAVQVVEIVPGPEGPPTAVNLNGEQTTANPPLPHLISQPPQRENHELMEDKEARALWKDPNATDSPIPAPLPPPPPIAEENGGARVVDEVGGNETEALEE